MEWYLILALFTIVVLIVLLGVLLACMLVGQRCTVSLQQRTSNHEQTRVQQENELRNQNKFSSKVKRAFGAAPQSDQPAPPLEDVKTVEFTFKLGDDRKQSEPVATNSEQETVLLPPPPPPPMMMVSTQEARDARERRREAMRRKYNL